MPDFGALLNPLSLDLCSLICTEGRGTPFLAALTK